MTDRLAVQMTDTRTGATATRTVGDEPWPNLLLVGVIIGRDPRCDVVLDDDTVAAVAAQHFAGGHHRFVYHFEDGASWPVPRRDGLDALPREDLGFPLSRHGPYRIRYERLADGTVRVGPFTLVFLPVKEHE